MQNNLDEVPPHNCNHQLNRNQYYIGLSGNDISFIDTINATGIMDDYLEPLNINIQIQVII